MFRELHKDATLVRTLLLLLITAVCIHLFSTLWQFLNLFSDVIGIIVVSWLLSFVLEPVSDYISSFLRIGQRTATGITYALLFLFFLVIGLIFIPMVNTQIQTLSKVLPQFIASTPPFLNKWNDDILQSLNNSIGYIPSIAQFLLSTIIILVVSFYFIIDKDRINREVYKLAPAPWHEKMRFIQKVITTTFASFLRIQLIIGLMTGIATWIVLQLTGVPFAIAVAVLAGFLGVIPLIGPILAAIPPVFFAFIINPYLAAFVLLWLILIQQIFFNIFVPRMFGRAFKIHPVIILLSSIAGFRIGGALGAIFAIPIAGIAAVIIKDIWHYFLGKDEENR